MNTLLWRDKCNFVQQMITKIGVVWKAPRWWQSSMLAPQMSPLRSSLPSEVLDLNQGLADAAFWLCSSIEESILIELNTLQNIQKNEKDHCHNVSANENLGIDRSFMRCGGVSQFCSNYCLQSSMLLVALSDPAPTSAPSKKSGFGIFLDRMKPNPTQPQDRVLGFFFLVLTPPEVSFFFPSPTPYLLLFPSFLFSLPLPAHNFFFFLWDLFIFVWLCLRSLWLLFFFFFFFFFFVCVF